LSTNALVTKAAATPFIVKLLVAVAIAILLVVGLVGLLLPILPGILFIFVAAFLLTRYFPSIDRRLRRNRTVSGYLDDSETIAGLEWPQKLKLGALLTARAGLRGVEWLIVEIRGLLRRVS
jgi:uncharacterized membrane protein YbaN (DUF454 family)